MLTTCWVATRLIGDCSESSANYVLGSYSANLRGANYVLGSYSANRGLL